MPLLEENFSLDSTCLWHSLAGSLADTPLLSSLPYSRLAFCDGCVAYGPCGVTLASGVRYLVCSAPSVREFGAATFGAVGI